MSQDSIASSIPLEIIENQDEDFVNELNAVDDLYFGETTQTLTSAENSDTDDSESLNYESDNTDSDAASCVQLELCDEDNKEYIAQAKFRNESCGCKEFYGQPCSEILNFDSVIEYRESCKEFSREELDIVIKSQLFAHRRSGSHTEAKKHKAKVRERPYQEFFFNGKRVCRQMFCFLHGIEKKKLLAIAKSLDVDGLKPRVHGRVGKLPANSLTFSDRERIKTFLCKYAKDNALPLPGRLPNFKNSQVLLLPSDKSIEDILEIYLGMAEGMDFRMISLRTFQRLWNELCPHIVITKPCTDLCQKCQEFAVQITNSGNLSEEEKSSLLQMYNDHVQLAKEQRDYYRLQCLMSKNNFASLPCQNKEPGNEPCSVNTSMHYSWDYAQQVHFPHHAQQVGPVYFRTPRKCNIFGMCSEGSGKQTFYLIDESESPGKGANSVVSMVHHYLKHYGSGENHAKFHFDNCCGQNKNNTVLWYGLWRVLTGLHKTIEFSMMIAGHTKFEPDWHFGIWKVKWRNINAETMNQIADSVNFSSRNGHNIAQLVNNDEKPVVFYDWKKKLQHYFKPLKHISKYHHLSFSSDNPGSVVCKESSTSPAIVVNLLKKQVACPDFTDMPEQIVCTGLDTARQWYLYEHIREFCTSEDSKDAVCPKPQMPKPRNIPNSSFLENCNTHSLKRKHSLLA